MNGFTTQLKISARKGQSRKEKTNKWISFFFSVWVFFHEHSRMTGLQGKRQGISLTPHYHLHPLHRHLNISRAITKDSLPLHIASSRTRTGNLRFPSTSCSLLSYAPKDVFMILSDICDEVFLQKMVND